VYSASSAVNDEGPLGNTVFGGVGSIEGNLSDGGRIICGGCAGNDDGIRGIGETRGEGVFGLSNVEGATGEIGVSGEVGVGGVSGEVGVGGASGAEDEKGVGAAKELASLSSEDTEPSSEVGGVGDADETVCGRRGTFVE